MSVQGERFELHFGGFGKLPTQGDFVRVAAHTQDIEPLDQWIQGGMMYARNALSTRWKGLYEQAFFHSFVFRPERGDKTVIGVMRGASDAHQRLYPFVSYALISKRILDYQPTLVTVLHDVLFPLLTERIAWALEAQTVEEILAVMTAAESLSSNIEMFTGRYQNFLHEQEMQELGYALGLDGRTILQELTVAFDLHRSTGRMPGMALAFPLTPATHLRALELKFWTELYLLGFQSRQLVPARLSLFWPTRAEPDLPAMLVLTDRLPSDPLLVSLLSPGAGQAAVWTPGLGPNPFGLARTNLSLSMGATLFSVIRSQAPGYPMSCPWV